MTVVTTGSMPAVPPFDQTGPRLAPVPRQAPPSDPVSVHGPGIPYTGPVTVHGLPPVPDTGPFPVDVRPATLDTGPSPVHGLPAVPDTGPKIIEAGARLPVPVTPTRPQLPAPETGPLEAAPLTYLGGAGRRAAAPAFRPSTRRRSGGMRRRSDPAVVSVDNNRCHLYAICQQEAPASFLVARDGRLYYDAAPPEHQMASVRQAARLCPMQAIKLGGDSTR